MTTDAVIGYGSGFSTNYLDSPDTWTRTAEVIGFSLPPISRDAIDASHECKPNEWRTSLPGLSDGGEVSVQMNFTVEEYQVLRAELTDQTIWPRRVILPDNSMVEFSAYLTGLEVGITVADRISCTARFKTVGEPATIMMGGSP